MQEYTAFIRKPFKIEAVQITEENIQELAELLGGSVQEKKGRPFIMCNRKVTPQSDRAQLGGWITVMDNNLRVYPDKVFRRMFMEFTEEWEPHLEEPRKHREPKPKPEPEPEIQLEAEPEVDATTALSTDEVDATESAVADEPEEILHSGGEGENIVSEPVEDNLTDQT